MKGATMEKLENRLISAICYFVSLTPLIFIAMFFVLKPKSSDYVKFHVNQGLVLHIVILIIMFFINVVFELAFTFNTLLFLISVVIIIWGIINSLTGKTKEIPVIGKLHLIKTSFAGN
jgi:uncharacterized membrane protein